MKQYLTTLGQGGFNLLPLLETFHSIVTLIKTN